MKYFKLIGSILLVLFFSQIGFAQLKHSPAQSGKKHVRQKQIVAKFLRAGVLEGAGSYTFQDATGKCIYFAFDDYYKQNLPYAFFDGDANTNAKWINATFKIQYTTQWEVRGESEERQAVNRIRKIVLIRIDDKEMRRTVVH